MQNSNDRIPGWFIGMCALAALGIIFAGTVFFFGLYSVGPGEMGIIMKQGEITGVETPGLVVVMPWKRVEKVNVSVQVEEEDGDVPTSQGLQCKLANSLVFRIDKDPAKVTKLWKEVGPDYQKKLVERSFQSAIRLITTKHTAEDLYTVSRDKIEGEMLKECQTLLEPYGIICEQVLMKSVTLPNTLANRITEKQAAEQDVQRMSFVLKQKELEAQARTVEAKGIADAQKIIKADLDHNYLIWEWIQTLKTHTGATIYIPTGADGMPLFKEVTSSKK